MFDLSISKTSYEDEESVKYFVKLQMFYCSTCGLLFRSI